jgi:glutamate synthase (NADPH/NADH)
LAYETILKLKRDNALDEDVEPSKVIYNYRKACDDGILKVMSKMGISTMQSYKGAQIFEALGLDSAVVQKCFAGTASRIKGVGFELLAADAFALHEMAYPSHSSLQIPALPDVGELHWRAGGEQHINEPQSVAMLQEAVRDRNEDAYQKYSRQAYEQIKHCTLRGLLDFRSDVKPVPVEEVEPWQSIVKRFCTGAMR